MARERTNQRRARGSASSPRSQCRERQCPKPFFKNQLALQGGHPEGSAASPAREGGGRMSGNPPVGVGRHPGVGEAGCGVGVGRAPRASIPAAPPSRAPALREDQATRDPAGLVGTSPNKVTRLHVLYRAQASLTGSPLQGESPWRCTVRAAVRTKPPPSAERKPEKAPG